MINFHIDTIRTTINRLAELAKSADRQASDVKSTFDTAKSTLINKIDAVKLGIATAGNDISEARGVIAQNRALEAEMREQIRVAEQRRERAQRSKTSTEARLHKVEARYNVVSAIPSEKAAQAASRLASMMSDLRSDIRDLEVTISEQNKIISDAMKVIAMIEKANKDLEVIIKNCEQAQRNLKVDLQKLEKLKERMESQKKEFDAKYSQTKRTMPITIEKSEKAMKAAESAMRYFGEAGCGHSKQVSVDSPSTISRLSYEISSAASNVSHHAFEVGCESERYTSRLRDKISAEVKENVKRGIDACNNTKSRWDTTALALKNAAFQLEMYLECKL